jgi:PAS domain S-box-containing protein
VRRPGVAKPAVFIVEDEAIVANDISETLKSLGYTVSGTAGKIHTELNIPVIFLTAHADEALLERAKVTEPYGYIIKPYDERELHSTIEMALYKFHTNERIRENEQLVRSLVNINTEPVFILDQDTNVLFINDAFASLRPGAEPPASGLTLERLAFADMISGKLVGAVQSHFYDNTPFRFEEEFKGKWISHTITPLAHRNGKNSLCAVQSYDITDLKKRELDLAGLTKKLENEKESLVLYGAMMENMDDFVIATDMKGTIFYVNKSFQARFGYSQAEMRGKHISVLKDPEDQFAMDTDAFYVDKKKVWSGNFTAVSKYKIRVKTSLKGSPVSYDGQTVCRIFVLRERLT